MDTAAEDIPSPLREGMNSVASITTLNTYRARAGKDVLGGALDVDAQYDKQRAQFVSNLESVELRFIIEDYKSLNRGDSFWDTFDPDTCTWHHVHDELNRVEDEYRRKGIGNVLRRTFRSEGLTRNLVPLLEGIPDSDGLGFLKGGLIILFNAIKRRAQACAKIFAFFRQVPNLLRGAHDVVKRFPDSQELYSCSCRFHEELFHCLPRLIALLLRDSDQYKVKKWAKSLFGDEVADADRILQSLTAAQNALNWQADRLGERRDDRMAKQVDHTEAEVRQIRRNQHDHQHQVLTRLQQLDETQKTYASFIEAQIAKIESQHAEEASLRQEASRHYILNLVHQSFEEMLRNRDFFAVTEAMQPRAARQIAPDPSAAPYHPDFEPAAAAAPAHDVDELMMILCDDVEAGCHADDLYATLRRYDAFSDKALAHAAHLSETPRFARWLQGPRSDLLLADGHCGHHADRRASPLSVFCASLVQSLLPADDDGPAGGAAAGRPPSLVLYFFCGRHVRDGGPLAGPQGLVRSLAAQLLLAWRRHDVAPPPDLGFLAALLPGPVAAAREDLGVGTACRVLHALVRQLPADATVHCVVDGVSQFETVLGGWADDMWEVADCLRRCAADGAGGGPRATVKVLLASADRSTVVCDLFSRDHLVELRAGSFYSSFVSPRALMSSLQEQASFSDLVADDESDDEYVTEYGRYTE